MRPTQAPDPQARLGRTRKSAAILLLTTLCLTLAACMTPEPLPEGPKIKFGWGGTIWGHGYWSMYSDDTIIYDGRQDGAKPELSGWVWTDRADKKGYAQLQIPGAYQNALAIAEKARRNPIFQHRPQELLCLDAGYSTYWLDPNSDEVTLRVGCLPDDPKAQKDQQFIAAHKRLHTALYDLVPGPPE